MKKAYRAEEHNGISWQEIRYRATRPIEMFFPFFLIYFWGTGLVCSSTLVNPPSNPSWLLYYFIVIWGGLASLLLLFIIREVEKARKICEEYNCGTASSGAGAGS